MFPCIIFSFNKCFPNLYKTQEMCDRTISDDSISLRYAPDQHKTSKNV